MQRKTRNYGWLFGWMRLCTEHVLIETEPSNRVEFQFCPWTVENGCGKQRERKEFYACHKTCNSDFPLAFTILFRIHSYNRTRIKNGTDGPAGRACGGNFSKENKASQFNRRNRAKTLFSVGFMFCTKFNIVFRFPFKNIYNIHIYKAIFIFIRIHAKHIVNILYAYSIVFCTYSTYFIFYSFNLNNLFIQIMTLELYFQCEVKKTVFTFEWRIWGNF